MSSIAFTNLAHPSDNQRKFIQGRCEDDCARAQRAAYIGRALSVIYVGIGLVFAALAVRQIFPRRDALLLLTAVLIAFDPQVLHIGSSVSNDSLMILLMNAGFYLAVRWLNGARSRRMVMILGLVAGAALLTKLSAVSLGLVLGLLLLVTSERRLHDTLLYGLSELGICGWWLVYNNVLYGDPTATNVHLQFAPQHKGPATFSEVLSQLRTVVRSLWAEFGWGQVYLPDHLHDLIIFIIIGSLILGIIYFALRWRALSKPQRGFLLVGGGITGLVFLLLLRWMATTQAPHGRLLFPAVLPISLFMAAGLTGFVTSRWRIYWVAAISLGLLGFALWVSIEFIRPAYAAPQPVITPEPGAELMRFYEPEGGIAVVRDVALIESQDWLYVQISWQIEAPFEDIYQVFVHALNANGEIVSQRDSYPGLSNMPFTRIETGALFHDIYPLAIPTKPVETLRIGVYRIGDLPNTWERLAAESVQFTVEDDAVIVPRELLRFVRMLSP